jgi:hypothetical protein
LSLKVNRKKAKSAPFGGKCALKAKTLSLTLRRRFFTFVTFSAIFHAVSHAQDIDSPFSNTHHFGPAYDRYPQVLSPGSRTEVLGPLFGWETSERGRLFRFTPLFSLYRDSVVEQTEFEVAYPILAFDKFGKEYRFHIFQVLSWSGGESLKGGDTQRTTISPSISAKNHPIQKRITPPFFRSTAGCKTDFSATKFFS